LGAQLWGYVIHAYKEQSGEITLQDKDDVKRHWTEKMCNKFKKSTGNQGAAKNFILHCQRIQLKILKKYKTPLMGVGDSSGDESGSSDGENSNIYWHG
jgi:hypothetical protein